LHHHLRAGIKACFGRDVGFQDLTPWVKRALARAIVGALCAAPHWARPALARMVPGQFAQFGPPRRWARNDSFARRTGADWRVLKPAELVSLPAPDIEGPISPTFFMDRTDVLPPQGVLVLEDAWVAGTRGVIARDGCYLPDCGYFSQNVGKGLLFERGYAERSTRLEGTTLSLATDWADTNFYHLLVDAVPRLHLFEAAGFRLDEVDRVYIPSLDSAPARAVWARLGLPSDKVVFTRDHPVVWCRRLIATTFPGAPNQPTGWAVRFLRERLGAGTVGKRRIYVSRRGAARDLTNADAIERLVQRLGFEVRVPGQAAGDLDVFAEAQIIVGPHGAGLGNALLMPAGGVLIDLLPPSFQTRCHFSWSSLAGVRYTALVGRDDPAHRGVPPMRRPFSVDPERLERLLARVGQQRPVGSSKVG